MPQKTQAQIISVLASAGSGKTYSLAKKYIELLFDKNLTLKNIIATTFAKKAALEMRYRIIEYLKTAALSMDAKDVFENIPLTKKELSQKSNQILADIFDNYDDFAVSTIDSFKNRLLRACAINLNLSPDFQIDESSSQYLQFALDSCLRKSLKNNKLKNLFDKYLKQYLQNESSHWFITSDIYAKIADFFNGVSNASSDIESNISDDYVEKFYSLAKDIEKNFISLFNIINEEKLNVNKNIIKYLEKIEGNKKTVSNDEVSVYFNVKHNKLSYNKNSAESEAANNLFLEITHKLENLYNFKSERFYDYYIALYLEVYEQLQEYTNREKIILLSEINKKTYNLFSKPESIPEAYLRMSAKYKCFLMDEFQDTSQVQWTGIKRLIEESLSSSPDGMFFCVGDAKQAIFEFRGGQADIFLNIDNEFTTPVEHKTLSSNYRSHKTIVEFNNERFSMENLEKILNGNDDYNNEAFFKVIRSYENLHQNFSPKKDKGYVEVKTISEDKLQEEFLNYTKDLIERFGLENITVLCRTSAEVNKITNWLMQEGIPFQTRQSLDITKNPIILQLISFLRFILNPMDNLAFASIVLGDIFLKKTELNFECMQAFLFEYKSKKTALYRQFQRNYFPIWQEYFEEFFKKAGLIPIYELCISILAKFSVLEDFAADKVFILRFLEFIKEFEKDKSGLANFIEYLNSLLNPKQDKPVSDKLLFLKTSIQKSIKIMTMHTAKGLQFPVVIIPFGKFKVGANANPIFIDKPKFHPIYMTTKIYPFSEKLTETHQKLQARSFISELNVLYVASTRAKCEMYIFIPYDADELSSKEHGKSNLAVSLFGLDEIRGVKGSKEQYKDEIKEEKKEASFKDEIELNYKNITASSRSIGQNDLMMCASQKEGIIIHFILSKIITLKDRDDNHEINFAIEQAVKNFHDLPNIKELKEKVLNFILSPQIKPFFYFAPENVFNEKEIVTAYGETLRVDKIVFGENFVNVLDFKSSNIKEKENIEQVKNYMQQLKQIYPKKQVNGFIADINAKKVINI